MSRESSFTQRYCVLRDLVRDAPALPDETRSDLLAYLDKLDPNDIQACVEYRDAVAPPPARIYLP